MCSFGKQQIKGTAEGSGGKIWHCGGDLKEITQRYEGIKEEYDQIQGEIERLDKSIEEARSTLTDTGLLRGRLEGQINVLKEQIIPPRGASPI